MTAVFQRTSSIALGDLLCSVQSSAGDLKVEAPQGDAVASYAIQRLEAAYAESPGFPDTQVRFPFRALKFNLPWVSYRSAQAIDLHQETCRDLAFWESLLDMMAENRFNALTLWSLHPFHLMIRTEKYPEACDLNLLSAVGLQLPAEFDY